MVEVISHQKFGEPRFPHEVCALTVEAETDAEYVQPFALHDSTLKQYIVSEFSPVTPPSARAPEGSSSVVIQLDTYEQLSPIASAY